MRYYIKRQALDTYPINCWSSQPNRKQCVLKIFVPLLNQLVLVPVQCNASVHQLKFVQISIMINV